jgi:hypothetical protein
MERDYDEVISDMLIQLAQIEQSLVNQNTRMEAFDARTEAFDKRMDLTIRRMVKAESRLEASERRMERFDQKLEQSIIDQREFSVTQSQMNKYFIDYINNTQK